MIVSCCMLVGHLLKNALQIAHRCYYLDNRKDRNHVINTRLHSIITNNLCTCCESVDFSIHVAGTCLATVNVLKRTHVNLKTMVVHHACKSDNQTLQC